MHTKRTFAFLAGLALLAACGGGGGSAASSGEAGASAGGGAATRGEPAAEAPLPVEKPTGPIDEELAERGEKLFSSKGCVACHTIGQGKRVGPDLKGITEKTTFPWIFHWVSNPDSMLRSDTTAQRLLREYLVPMPNQNVSPDEFQALYEYLRQQGQEGADSESAAAPAAGGGGMMGGMGSMGGMHSRMHDRRRGRMADTSDPNGAGVRSPGATSHHRRN